VCALFVPVPSNVDGDVEKSDSLSLSTGASLPDSEPDSPLTRAHDTITRILELGPTLSDVGTKSLEIHKHDAAQFDIGHVRGSFSAASTHLIERLGRANWERRQYLVDVQVKMDLYEAHSPETHSMEHVLRNVRLELSDSESESEKTEMDDRSQSDTHDNDSEMSTIGSSYGGSPGATATPSLSQISTAGTELTVTADAYRAGRTVYQLPLPPSPNATLTGEPFVCPFCGYKIAGMSTMPDWR